MHERVLKFDNLRKDIEQAGKNRSCLFFAAIMSKGARMANLQKIAERREKRRAENERWIRNHIGQGRGYSYRKRHPGEDLSTFRDRRTKTNRRKKNRLLQTILREI